METHLALNRKNAETFLLDKLGLDPSVMEAFAHPKTCYKTPQIRPTTTNRRNLHESVSLFKHWQSRRR